MLARQEVPIAADDTTGSLTARLAQLAASLLVETLEGWTKGQLKPEPQPEGGVTYCHELAKEAGKGRYQVFESLFGFLMCDFVFSDSCDIDGRIPVGQLDVQESYDEENNAYSLYFAIDPGNGLLAAQAPAHTLKGKGLSPFEKDSKRKHGKPLTEEEARIALAELDSRD